MNTKKVKIGNICIGGGEPVAVQSMLNREAHDVPGNVQQAQSLEKAGCDIVRLAVPDKQAVKTLAAVKESVGIPVVADIHFDYRLALESVAAGVDKIRINPGNIGDESRVKQVAVCCANAGVPIRIGVNSGSVEKEILARYGSPVPEALCDSAMGHAALLEKYDFDQIVISIKSSHVPTMVIAYRLMSERCSYALHLGVTETGTKSMGIIKSAAGIGALLLDSIGDTVRVSLTASPEQEVYAGYDILRATGRLRDAPELISCPTCGRTKIDLIPLAEEVEKRLRSVHKPIKVAVMGCVVNGPGEAREADVGIAGGNGCAVIFRHGEVIRKVPEQSIADELMKEIERL